MAEIIEFPSRAPAPLPPTAIIRPPVEWVDAAGQALRSFGWMWGTGQPEWLGNGWWSYVKHRWPDMATQSPQMVDWSLLWQDFVESWLVYQPEWRRLSAHFEGASYARKPQIKLPKM